MASVPISKVTPDFQALFTALQRRLEEKQTWTDLLPTSMGTTILDAFAGSHVSNQLYTEISFRESFLPTAVRDSSIYAGTRMLGVQIARKTPAGCVAELTNTSEVTKFVPPYSQFDLGGRKFFNRAQYVIPPTSSIRNANLFSGEVFTKSFDLEQFSDLALKEFFLEEPGFVVSAADIVVYTESKISGKVEQWELTDKAIFEHTPSESVYYESTTRDGDVSLKFGDGRFGRLLDRSSYLRVRAVRTDGAAGSNGLPGTRIKLVGDTSVVGETLSAISGGADQKGSLYYKLFAPNMARTKRRAISGTDIRAALMDYPGVADCSIMGQRDIAPNDVRWMNTVRICVLPENEDTFGGANPNPKSAQWNQLVEWLKPKLHDAYDVQTWNPTKMFVPVRVKLAILPGVDAAEIRIVAIDKILKLFQKKPGILGRRLSKSDIDGELKKIEGVDYVEIISPTEEIKPADRTQYVVLDGTPIIDVVYSERSLGVRGAY